MLRKDTPEDRFISNRVNMPTHRQTNSYVSEAGTVKHGLDAVSPGIRNRAFFSARVGNMRILERIREVSDAYSRGEIGKGEARNRLKDFFYTEGIGDGTNSLKNLAGTARLNLILEQNEKMANAVGRYHAMMDPEVKEAFPYVIYHASVGSRNPRAEHQRFDGKVYSKDDPWLRTHWPPSKFGCNCELEECSAKRAGRLGIIPKTPPEKVTVDSQSGFVFDPATAFEETDISALQPVSREVIIREAEEAVKDQQIGKCALGVAPATTGLPAHHLEGEDELKGAFEAMKDAARNELKASGLNPDQLPDYEEVNQSLAKAGKAPKNIPGSIRERFPAAPIRLTTIDKRVSEAAGLPELPVTLERGNAWHGVEHLWRDHKDLFADPAKAVTLLKQTLGDPNCRVMVSLERTLRNTQSHGKAAKTPDCLKKVVLHNPARGVYCVMTCDGKSLKLVSWHNSPPQYGIDQWSIKE